MKSINLKERIEKWLEKTGKNRKHLEDKAGVGRGLIYRYLNNERDMTVESAEKILKIVG